MSLEVKRIALRDEIGQTRVVFKMSYRDRSGNPVYCFIGITRKGNYILFRGDSSRVLYRSHSSLFPSLKRGILELLRQMKKEIKLNINYE